jgi:hypothetical protein
MGTGASFSNNKYSQRKYPEDDPKSYEESKRESSIQNVKWPNVNKCAKFTSPDTNLCSWDFNIWILNPEEFPVLCSSIILYYTLPTKFNIKYQKWCGLFRKVQLNMLTPINPYHNITHLVDVMQTCAAFLGEMDAASILNDTDILSLFLAAFVHDIGHPGLSNLYQINAGTPLAIRYNDISVLENHHCSLAFEVFKESGSNVFLDVPVLLRKVIRKTIIQLILSTDMESHFRLTDELNECVTRHFTPLKSIVEMKSVVLNDKDRCIVLRSILHAADISNPAKNYKLSKKWSDFVVEEFFAQGDREKLEHLPVSMNMDRNTCFQDEISLNFNDFIVAPFFLTLLKAFPKIEKGVRYLESNRNEWDMQLRSRVSNDKRYSKIEIDEILSKWTIKNTEFTLKVKAALLIADSKLEKETINIDNEVQPFY